MSFSTTNRSRMQTIVVNPPTRWLSNISEPRSTSVLFTEVPGAALKDRMFSVLRPFVPRWPPRDPL